MAKRKPWRYTLPSGIRVEVWNLDPHPDGDGATRRMLARLNAAQFARRELAWLLDREYGSDRRGPGFNWGQWPT